MWFLKRYWLILLLVTLQATTLGLLLLRERELHVGRPAFDELLTSSLQQAYEMGVSDGRGDCFSL